MNSDVERKVCPMVQIRMHMVHPKPLLLVIAPAVGGSSAINGKTGKIFNVGGGGGGKSSSGLKFKPTQYVCGKCLHTSGGEHAPPIWITAHTITPEPLQRNSHPPTDHCHSSTINFGRTTNTFLGWAMQPRLFFCLTHTHAHTHTAHLQRKGCN